MFGADNVNHQYSYLVEANTISKDVPPIFINQMNQAILRQATNNQNFQITVEVSPLPNTYNFAQLQNSISGIVAAFMFSIGLSFIPASMITFTVKEREEKVKHQQLVSGVGLFAYWTSNLVIDFFKALIPCLFGIAMVYAYDITAF